MGNDYYLTHEKSIKVEDTILKEIYMINSDYIICKTKAKMLNLYDMNIRSFGNIKINSDDFILKFHPKYKNIFLLADGIIIDVYEILENTYKLNKKITAEGHTQPIKLLEFSESYEKTFVTYSEDRTIKLWKFNCPSAFRNIIVKDKIDDLQICYTFIFYQYKTENALIRNNYRSFDDIKTYKADASKFIIIDTETFVLINEYIVSIYKENEELEKFELEDSYFRTFYDKKLKLLYICFQNDFKVINLEKRIIEWKTRTNYNLKDAFFSNRINNLNIYAYFILKGKKKINFFSFCSKKNLREKKLENIYITDEFWNDSIPNISDIANLEWNQNIYDEKKESYLMEPNIFKEIKLNFEKTLSDKKNEVMKELKEINFSNADLDSILKLVIKDNTNKELMLNYLKFLKDNKDKINGKINYNSEYECYNIMFENNDLKKYNLEEKQITETEKFNNLLNRIKNLNLNDKKQIDDLKKDVTNMLTKLQTFNQPINFDNRELYWYRNLINIYLDLNSIFNQKDIEETLKNLKENITIILDQEIFKKKYVLNNKELLTSILILIHSIETPIYLKFNLNLIKTKDPDYKYEEDLEKNNCEPAKVFNIVTYNVFLNGKIYSFNEPSSSCITNFILNINENKKFKDLDLLNYDKMKESFNEIIDFDKMKKFLAKIYCSNVIREAFNILYKDSGFRFPFKDEQDAEKFLKEYYHFTPLKSSKVAAITERFTLEIYYFLGEKNVIISGNHSDEIKKLINQVLYRGACTKTSCHEINHEFYNLFFMHNNGLIPIETPRKNNVNEREGGKNIERLIFNRIVKKLTLLECLYLLNEKNYEKSLIKFREGFNELKIKDMKFDKDNIFQEFDKISKIENIKTIGVESTIRGENNDDSNTLVDSVVDQVEDSNDVLGFIREPSKC